MVLFSGGDAVLALVLHPLDFSCQSARLSITSQIVFCSALPSNFTRQGLSGGLKRLTIGPTREYKIVRNDV